MALGLDDTIAAIATPLGEGAIGMVRLSGPQALQITQSLFRPSGRRLARGWTPRRLYHGHVVNPETTTPVDEVLVTYFRGPRSYTGQDVVEISGHGGSVSVREVLRLAVRAGARPAERGEMTLRAFLAGKLDLAQAEAVADAVRSQTPAALSLAVQQLRGSLSSLVGCVRRDLLQVYAHLEATIDFAEDDVPPPSKESIDLPLCEALAQLDGLLATARAGTLHREGMRVALIGRPNVGKSSLLNALLQSERAIVTPIAGTTRDVIEETIDLGGIPAVLADTAGITDTDDPVEQIGVRRSQSALAAADVVVLVIDGSMPLTDGDREIAVQLQAARRAVVTVLSKADLALRVEVSAVGKLLPAVEMVPVSAVTSQGLEALRQALLAASGATAADVSGRRGQAIVTSTRHRQVLERARESLAEAIASTQQEAAADFVCIDLRAAIQALGEITGENVTEDLLTAIFSRFCIGK
jgi:tRNA modification GTPase